MTESQPSTSTLERPPQIGAWLQDKDFGWRARLGVINPSAGITLDHEWARMLPGGVSYHVTRLLLENGTFEALHAMARDAPQAAKLLKSSRVNALCYGCTIGSLYLGIEGERELAARLEDAASAPVIMMAASAAEAMRALGAQRVAVANPYTAATNELVRQYLEECGFEVATVESASVQDSWSIAKLQPSHVKQLAVTSLQKSPDVDCLFLSCGNMRTIEVISTIEAETGCPVVSSNQAMLWRALRTVGVFDQIAGFGRLMGLAENEPLHVHASSS